MDAAEQFEISQGSNQEHDARAAQGVPISTPRVGAVLQGLLDVRPTQDLRDFRRYGRTGRSRAGRPPSASVSPATRRRG